MDEWPPVVAMLVTYKRTDLAVRTVTAVKEKLTYPKLGWHIADDGSPLEHMEALFEAIGERVPTTNALRKGAGRSMNWGQKEAWQRANYILWLEDDWELVHLLDLRPFVQMMEELPTVGMIRMGYISPGLSGTLTSAAGQLWWLLNKGDQYTFAGHAQLRARRFFKAYGPYKEGLTPGQEELYMCSEFTYKQGPTAAINAEMGIYGYFAHIGGESLNNIKPEGG